MKSSESDGKTAALPERQQVVLRYIEGLRKADGPAVAALFLPDGVIDDFRGGRHRGSAAIEKLMSQRARSLEAPLNLIDEGDRVTAYGRLLAKDGEAVLVRWVFHFSGDLISHLGNSRVERIYGVAS